MRLLTALCLLLAAHAASAGWNYQMDAKTAGLSGISIGGRPVVLIARVPSGVHVEEIVSANGKPTALAMTDRFSVHVHTAREGDALLVTADIANKRGGDSAADVYYQIPLNTAGWVWHGDPLSGAPVGSGDSQDRYPISVLTNPKTGAGLAVTITPDTPCLFLAGCDRTRGLFVKAKVGFSDLTNPPSRVTISFAVYPVDGSWGMRSALKTYYTLFPKAYQGRSKVQGLWIFHGNATTAPNPTQFAFHSVGELGESRREQKLAVDILTPEQVKKEKAWGIEIYPYVIAGQREVGFLDHLKAEGSWLRANAEKDDAKDLAAAHYTTAEALDLLDHMTRKNMTFSQAIQSVPDYIRTVKNSLLIGPDGDIITRPRVCPWADKTLTFPVNPNPFIPGLNAGSSILDECREWLNGPWDGIYVDSLFRWGSYLSYRHDHFAYAKYGLTYGGDGRPCLDNSLEHLTFLDELGKLCRAKGRKLSANGVAKRCFWHAQRLDVAGSEFGPGTSLSDALYRRALMYHKPYVSMAHGLRGGEKDRRHLARCFLFGVYGSSDMPYFNTKDYPKVKDIYDTYLPIERKMGRLGWEPVTYARPLTEGILTERFGTGPVMYFSLYRNTGDASKADLELEAVSLKLAAKKVTATDPVSGKALKVMPASKGRLVIQGIPLSRDGMGVARVEVK